MIDYNTQKRILDEGKKEFLSKGFQNGSLRNIAKNANVTTGAIYGYYKDKESLFEALVEPCTSKMINNFKEQRETHLAQESYLQIDNMYQRTSRNIDWIIEYIFDNFDAFTLLICHATSTKFQDFQHQLVKIEVDSTTQFINKLNADGIKVNHVNEQLSHIFASSLINSIFEIVVHKIKKDTASQYLKSIMEFNTAGWSKILGVDFFKNK